MSMTPPKSTTVIASKRIFISHNSGGWEGQDYRAAHPVTGQSSLLGW